MGRTGQRLPFGQGRGPHRARRLLHLKRVRRAKRSVHEPPRSVCLPIQREAHCAAGRLHWCSLLVLSRGRKTGIRLERNRQVSVKPLQHRTRRRAFLRRGQACCATMRCRSLRSIFQCTRPLRRILAKQEISAHRSHIRALTSGGRHREIVRHAFERVDAIGPVLRLSLIHI